MGQAMMRILLAAVLLMWQPDARLFAADKSPKLPDAASVLDRYVQVTGGREHFRAFRFVTIDSTVTRDGGSTAYTTVFRSRDGRMQTEIDAGADSRAFGVSNGIAWEFSETKGARILSGKAASRKLAEARGLGEDDWRERFPSVKTAGEESINGKICYRLELKRTDGSVMQRFYDEKSGLLVREVSTEFDEAGIEQPVVTDIERYDTTLGSMYPSLMRVRRAKGTSTIQVNSVTYSTRPSAGSFTIPREALRAAAAAQQSGDLPNAVDIVEKFIRATGGADAHKTIRNEVITAEISLKEQNLTMPLTMYIAEGKSYSYFEIPTMGKFEFGSNGQTAWERSLVLGPRLVPRSTFGNLIGPNSREISRWMEGSLGTETVSKSEVNGSPCYLISMGGLNAGKPAGTACFDVKTGYLLKTVISDSRGVSTDTLFSDYRSHDGFTMAHHVETTLAGKAVAIQIKEITRNGSVPVGIFDLPADVQALVDSQKEQLRIEEAPGRPMLRRRPAH